MITSASLEDQDRFRRSLSGPTIKLYFCDMIQGVLDVAPVETNLQAAVEHSSVIRKRVEEEPGIQKMFVRPETSKLGLERFLQCISPDLRGDLPTHDMTVDPADPTRILSNPIKWTGDALYELHRTAHHLGSPDVLDMITDHILERQDELELSVAEMNRFAHQGGVLGIRFWTDLILNNEKRTKKLRLVYGDWGWSADMFSALRRKRKMRLPLNLYHLDPSISCRQYHHHHTKEGAGICYRDVVKARAAYSNDHGDEML
ncbi:hypothetical protein K491DRAFT_105690 [Lophiostoma macrostomum CBS 122681]|uniref:Uncharacterized protein n=1 Tax=Lophiostoma macrostomum CBS 122681 TaxID=1314788 RepID=A0A6A6TM40_9PLEO|nr:hypothetical protein K491DRAFT_105690 [Lophiostoma macrostomum CBS 122681]